MTMAPEPSAVEAIVAATHGDPFAILGPHDLPDGCAIRMFFPGADAVQAIAPEDGAVLADLIRVHPAGFWSGLMATRRPYRLRIQQGVTALVEEDPYRFGLVLGELDIYLMAEGRHRQLGEALGAHITTIEGVRGTRFAVWAPNARRVSVVGDFNFWDGRRHPMRLRQGAGVWELFIPGVTAGALYKYELIGVDGAVLPLRADPCAAAAELPPATASVVVEQTWEWQAREWRPDQGVDQPITIYEVHASSWLGQTEPGMCVWETLAERLVPYVRHLGFSHLELMPIMEHPFGGSWGYQPLGQFAPAARFGPPEQFAAFVDRCHQEGIAVILDWVPAHFPTDAHGLWRFDGTALYEHADPLEGFHPDWNTAIFNLGRTEVREFLIASALHWLERFRIDALRVDAVASMLYRDYSRTEGQWVPNVYGGRENLEAVAFLRELGDVVRERCPRAVLIAEESTAWPGVSRPASEGGLGFHYKWNMGWMHDTLAYAHQDPVHRRWYHDQMTFGLVYAFSERFILPLSHDEVVYGKGSLLGKMPGDAWQRFANLRAYFGFMWGHPGKKLLFMGGEIAQEREWDHDGALDWEALVDPRHAGVQHLVRDLNAVYRALPALHRRDAEGGGFRWVVIDDRSQSVFAFLRFGAETDRPVLVISNFTPVPRHDYRIGVPADGFWREVLNTDAELYGGTNLGNAGGVASEPIEHHGFPASVGVLVPPLATIMLELQ